MIKKIIIKIIIWILYIPCLWLFIEGSSFLATYVIYSYIDKNNPTKIHLRKLPILRPFSRHPLWAPDSTSENILQDEYDAFISHRFAPNIVYRAGKDQTLVVNAFGFIHNGDAKRQPFANDDAIKVVLLGGSSMV